MLDERARDVRAVDRDEHVLDLLDGHAARARRSELQELQEPSHERERPSREPHEERAAVITIRVVEPLRVGRGVPRFEREALGTVEHQIEIDGATVLLVLGDLFQPVFARPLLVLALMLDDLAAPARVVGERLEIAFALVLAERHRHHVEIDRSRARLRLLRSEPWRRGEERRDLLRDRRLGCSRGGRALRVRFRDRRVDDGRDRAMRVLGVRDDRGESVERHRVLEEPLLYALRERLLRRERQERDERLGRVDRLDERKERIVLAHSKHLARVRAEPLDERPRRTTLVVEVDDVLRDELARERRITHGREEKLRPWRNLRGDHPARHVLDQIAFFRERDGERDARAEPARREHAVRDVESARVVLRARGGEERAQHVDGLFGLDDCLGASVIGRARVERNDAVDEARRIRIRIDDDAALHAERERLHRERQASRRDPQLHERLEPRVDRSEEHERRGREVQVELIELAPPEDALVARLGSRRRRARVPSEIGLHLRHDRAELRQEISGQNGGRERYLAAA